MKPLSFLNVSPQKAISSCLLTFFCLPFFFFLAFTISQQVIRHRMKEQLEKGMLQSVTIAEKDLHWVEHGREILLNGKMFDVEEMVYHDKLVTIRGLYDEDETSLVRILNSLQRVNRDNNQLLSAFFKCMQYVYFTSLTEHNLQTGSHRLFADLIAPALPDQFLRIPVPPPQI
jgi:hypothetical protein